MSSVAPKLTLSVSTGPGLLRLDFSVIQCLTNALRITECSQDLKFHLCDPRGVSKVTLLWENTNKCIALGSIRLLSSAWTCTGDSGHSGLWTSQWCRGDGWGGEPVRRAGCGLGDT